MKSFKVSADFEFNIRLFPFQLSELCLEVKRLRDLLAPLLIETILRKVESYALEDDLSLLGAVKHDYRRRTFQTCLGKLTFKPLRVKPVGEKSRYALKRYVYFDKGQYTADSLESAVSLLPHLSYRRSSMESKRLTGCGPTKSTLHRKVKELEENLERHPTEKARGYKYLFVDGTGVRLQDTVWKGDARIRLSESGELRMVYASRGLKEPVEVVGRWHKSANWDEIARQTYERIEEKDVIQLTTDGEDGIEAAFMRPGIAFQRCTTHAWRSIKQPLRLDGLGRPDRQRIQKQLYGISAFDIAVKQNLESLKLEDKQTVAKQLKQSETSLLELQQWLGKNGYNKTAIYIKNLSNPLLTFMRQWLNDGKPHPTTNNISENRFSLFKNRIRNIGKRWSEEGILRIVDLIIHKIFPGYNWNSYWKSLFPSENRVKGYILAIR